MRTLFGTSLAEPREEAATTSLEGKPCKCRIRWPENDYPTRMQGTYKRAIRTKPTGENNHTSANGILQAFFRDAGIAVWSWLIMEPNKKTGSRIALSGEVHGQPTMSSSQLVCYRVSLALAFALDVFFFSFRAYRKQKRQTFFLRKKSK